MSSQIIATRCLVSLLILVFCISSVHPFVPGRSSDTLMFLSQQQRQSSTFSSSSTTSRPRLSNIADGHTAIQKNVNVRSARFHTRMQTQLPSFFGLGPAEIAIVVAAGIVFFGPQKVAEWGREAGSAAGKASTNFGDEWKDLKKIPEEFEKGVDEGEIEARSRKAKAMDDVGEEVGGK